MHCGISTKPEMELLSCDLTSCYVCQSFTDLWWCRTWLIKKSKKSKKIKVLWFFDYLIFYFFHGPTDKPTIGIIEVPVPKLNQNNQKCLILLILWLIELVILVVFLSFNTLRHLLKIGYGIIAIWPSTMSPFSVFHWPLLIKDAWVTFQLIKKSK